MVPSSRKEGRGAYRDLMRNYIDGNRDLEHKIPGRKNTVTSDSDNIDFMALDIGYFNYVKIRKRIVASSDPEVYSRMSFNIYAGDRNKISIIYWIPDPEDFTSSVSAGDDNNIDVVLHEIDDVDIGSRNHIRGNLNVSTNGTVIGDDNILVDFEPEIVEGSSVYGAPALSELMFETEVTSISPANETKIEVADTSKIMLGGKIFFGTMGAAFADRIVSWVSGSFVGFDDPLSEKEVTIVGSKVFNHYPETVDLFETMLSEEAKKGSKRIVTEDGGDLHLRDISIAESFYTKSFFQRSSDNMVIIKDSLDDDYLQGAIVSSPGEYPYEGWSTSCSLVSGSIYTVGAAKHSAHVGRIVNIDSVDYTIVGFTSTTITFDIPLPINTLLVSFPPIDEAPGGGPSYAFLAVNSPGNSSIIEVDDASSFFIGQIIRLDEIVTLFTILSINGNIITLDEKIFGDSIDNSFYVGRVQLPIDIATTKAEIEAGALDLQTYIFGGS